MAHSSLRVEFDTVFDQTCFKTTHFNISMFGHQTMFDDVCSPNISRLDRPLNKEHKCWGYREILPAGNTHRWAGQSYSSTLRVMSHRLLAFLSSSNLWSSWSLNFSSITLRGCCRLPLEVLVFFRSERNGGTFLTIHPFPDPF